MRARASLLLLLCRASHAYEATADDDRTIPDGISCAAHEEIATFAAGCFWSVELAFQRVPGVLRTQVGYMGGDTERPAYESVYTGETGHAEVVQLVFDPAVVSYEELLEVFEKKLPTSAGHKTVGSHLTFDQLLAKPNPKDDHGTQYRSEVFTHSAEQHEAATAWKRRLEVERGSSIVTAISPAPAFWPAEEYHQQFLEKGGQDASKGSAEAIKCYG
jgi:peptide methionine sulfoxide reductase MsrA